jgi:cytoskeletal protein RodZ
MIQYTKEYIHSLLTKFMDGTTTLEEEDILNLYFTQGNVPAEWEEYRLLFAEMEGMKPQKNRKRWIGWSIAAAVVGMAVLSVAMLWQPSQQSPTLTAKADTTTVLRPEAPNEQPLPDTTALRKPQPVKQQHPRLRKPKPTIHDYDKAYTLMAEMEQEQQAVRQQIEQARQEVAHVQLTAAGFVPVMQEDGTVIYVEEPKEYFAYEE